MHSLSDQFPRALLGKHQLVMTVLFAAFFSLVFLLVSIPYTNNAWFELGRGESFLITVVFYTIALTIICLSKVGLYGMRNARNFTFWHYILWNAGEVLVISLLYTFFTIEGDKFGVITLNHSGFWSLLCSAVLYSTISLVIPYILSYQYFLIEDKNNTIRLMNYDNVVSDFPPAPVADRRITLFDNSGVLKFSINSENLYLIESDDNYIQVWYSDSTGEMKKYMLRCRLKTVEESFADSDLVRCHRKYIINIQKVRLLRSERDGYSLELETDSIPNIPVSKTYEQTVLARFNSRV